jgi:hypothetical protein
MIQNEYSGLNTNQLAYELQRYARFMMNRSLRFDVAMKEDRRYIQLQMQVQGYTQSRAFGPLNRVQQMVNTPMVSQTLRLSYNADLMTNLRLQIENMVAATSATQLYQNILNQRASIIDGFTILYQSGDLLEGVVNEYMTLVNLMDAYINEYTRSQTVQREQLDSMRRQLESQYMNYGKKKANTPKRGSYGKKSRK